MTTSRGHQGAHGIGQTEEQLNAQADAADSVQGGSEVDAAIEQAANGDAHTALDEIADA